MRTGTRSSANLQVGDTFFGRDTITFLFGKRVPKNRITSTWFQPRKQHCSGTILNRLDKEAKEAAAKYFSPEEFLHLKHIPSEWELPELPGSDGVATGPRHVLQVLKSPQGIAQAGLQLHNCAVSKINKVALRQSIICVVCDRASEKLLGMAEYVAERSWKLKQASGVANKPLPQETYRLFSKESGECKAYIIPMH